MIILRMKQILQKSPHHSDKFSIVCVIWYGWIQSSAMFKQQDVRLCGFRWSIPLSIDYIWDSRTDRAISTTSCSYCIWNRCCQNHRSILPNLVLCVWFDTVEFNRLPYPNDKIYNEVVFADRFRHHLTMFGFRVLIVPSRLLHARIAYETDTAKIIAAFCRIFYCLHDIIQLNSIVGRFQATRCTMM